MKNVEDIYPLSPVQQGMLFHALYAPDAGMYLEQKICTLRGVLNNSAFKQAWQEVVDRHSALRTGFLWQGLDEPLQVVRKTVHVSWMEEDWRGLSSDEQQKCLDSFIHDERIKGLDLAKPPLMRMALFQTAADAHEFVWMHHHILIDGWSLPLILAEVIAFYQAFSQNQNISLNRSRPYRDYIAWLQQQDLSKAEAFWRKELQGFTRPTSLEGIRNSSVQVKQSRQMTDQENIYGEQHLLLSVEETDALQALSRQYQLTMNTLVQGAWGLLLGYYTRAKDQDQDTQMDVVFGATVSGRPADLPGVESMIGLFINTLPVRINYTSTLSLSRWLKDLQERQIEARQYDYSPLTRVQEWSDVPQGQSLFESFLVYDNYPESPEADEGQDSLRIQNIRAFEQGNYRLVIKVRVAQGSGMALGTLHDRRYFDEPAIQRLLTNLKILLNNMSANPEIRLGELIHVLIETERKEKMIKRKKRKEVNLSSFMNVKPTAVAMSQQELVKTSYLNGVEYPLVIQPAMDDVALAEWAADSKEYLQKELLKHGAILFRGFGINSVAAFEGFAKTLCPDLYGDYGDLPQEDGKVYKSTPYPEDKTILFHNESSHMHTWPTKQFFCCLKAAEERGETPIVDCRAVYKRLDPAIIREFEQKKLRYVRNFIEGLDVSWQDFFRTTDKSVAEHYCQSHGIEFEWRGDNNLRMYQINPGVLKHPKTGEMSFFNQVQLHHVYFLDSELRNSVETLFSAEEYPRNVYYGDGTPIPDSVMEEIDRVYWDTCVPHKWQEGDVLMLDNMITAHARNPYKGERKIIVALAELTGIQELSHN